MVRLKDHTEHGYLQRERYFNSTMVRLKDTERRERRPSVTSFQFHYGTIKSKHGHHESLCFDNFNSTMVRLKGFFDSSFDKKDFHFNSTMVRLKAYFEGKMPDWERHFNSTMVRLKDRSVYRCVPISKFQFHYGTIKRPLLFWFVLCLLDFNSTMVRLKASGIAILGAFVRNFNSTMVRLKDLSYWCCACRSCISIPLWYD